MIRSSLILAALAAGPTAFAQTFTIVDDGIVLAPGAAGTYYEFNVGAPSAVYNPDDSEFSLYFEYRGAWGTPARCAGGAGTEWGIGRATSSDGIAWSVDPVASLHPVQGTFWECAAVHPHVVYEGPGQWHMFFKAWQESGKTCDDDIGNPDGIPDPTWGCEIVTGVGYASSTDGFNWTVDDTDPILTVQTDPDPEDFGWPRVLQVSGTWMMFMNYGDNGITVATAPNPEGPWDWEGYSPSTGYQEVISTSPILSWMEDELIVADVSCNDEPAADMLNILFGAHDRDNGDFWSTPLSRAFGYGQGNDVDNWTIGDPPEILWSESDIDTNVAWRSWTTLPVGTNDYIIYYQQFVSGANQVGLAYTTVDTNWDLNTIGGDICSYLGAAPDTFADAYNATEDTLLVVPAESGVLVDDVDHERNAITANLVVDASNGTVTLDPDGGFSYQPDLDFVGLDSFFYNATDGANVSQNAEVFITVAGTPDIPIALDDDYDGTEDTLLTVTVGSGVLSNDFDPDGIGAPLQALLQTDVSNGTLNLALDGSFDYTPDPDFEGVDTFTYVADNGSSSLEATVSLNIAAVNDAPTGSDEGYGLDEDTSLVVDVASGVLANAADVDLDPLTAELVTDVSDGILVLNADGSFDYTPNANFNGDDTFVYRVSDGTEFSADHTVTLTVNSLEDLPVALDDAYGGSEDTDIVADALTGVLANDSDGDGDPLTAVLDTDVSNGTLTLNADGSFTYTPDLNFSGVDTFTYVANDGDDDSSVVTVTLTIGGSNDLPVAGDDGYAVDEDTVLNVDALTGVLANDTDADLDPMTATLVDDVANGTLTLNADGSFDYTPNPDFSGVDSFTYTADDAIGSSELATVTLTVNAIEDTPVAVDDVYAGSEDTDLVVDALTGVLANDTDVDGDPLTAVLSTDVTDGTLTLNADGSFTYTPDLNFTGDDTFTYVANDGDEDSNEVTVTLSIGGSNDRPVANDDAYAVDEDGALSVDALTGVVANDIDDDGDPLTVALVADVTNGVLTLNADGSFDYTPNANFNGDDTFTYVANDGTEDSLEATVTVTVNPIEDLPTAVDDAYVAPEDSVLTTTDLTGVLANDTDDDGDLLTAALVTDVTNGSLTLNADGSFEYTPDPDFTGDDVFTYTASDGDDVTAPATVTITISGDNDAPVGFDDAYNVDEDSVLSVPPSGVLDNDTDTEGNLLTAALSVDVTNGVLVFNSDGSFDYTPNADFNGEDSFTYFANDGALDSGETTVLITVDPTNDSPVSADDGYQTSEDETLYVDAGTGLLANDTDIDIGDVLTATLVAGGEPSNGSLTLNPDGSFEYTPDADFNGPDSFTYRAEDGVGQSAITVVLINVTAVNDAPLAADESFETSFETDLTVGAAAGVLANDTDIEGDALTVGAYSQPLNGSVTVNVDGSFTYTPNEGYVGVDQFTYDATDGDLSDTGSVSITVADAIPTDTDTTDTGRSINPNKSDDGDLEGGGCGCESANVAFGAPWFLALALLMRRRRN